MAKGYREYIADLVEWVSFELVDEREKAKAEFFGSDEESDIYEHDDLAQTLFKLWFIFQRPCSASGITPLDIFISETRDVLPKKERKIYKGFRDNVLGFFKVVETGPLIKLMDLTTRNEYPIPQPQGTWVKVSRGEEVAEEAEGSPFEPGACIAGTLLPFQGLWVLTGHPVVFSEQTAYLIERRFGHQRDIEVSYRDILEFLSEPSVEEEEGLDSLRERISCILAEWDIANKFTVENLEKGLKKTSPEKLPQAIGRILTDLGISSEDINQELIDLLSKLHNLLKGEKGVGLLSKLHNLLKGKKEESATGPWESVLREDLYDYLQSKIDPDSYPDPKQLQRAIDKAEEEWLNTPQKEIADRTPREVIRAEREGLGHPHPDKISYEISLTPVEYRSPIHEEYHRAFEEQRKGNFTEAIEIYESILPQFEEHPDSFRLLGNLGACYALIGQKEEGLECLRKALGINPDYEFAKLNIQKIEEMSAEELMRTGVGWKRIAERLEKTLWNFEEIKEMSTREIEKRMKKLVPVFHLKKFVEKAQNYFSYLDLCRQEYEPFSVVEEHDTDFVPMACSVLWQRLLPDRPTVEHFDAELGDKLTELLEMKEADRDEEALNLSLEVLSLIKSPFISETPQGPRLNDGFYQRYKRDDRLKVRLIAKLMLADLGEAGRHEQRIEWAEVFSQAFRDDDFLQQKADSLIALGREAEGERAYQEILGRNPQSFWYHVYAGDVFSSLHRRDPKQAGQYYSKALEIAKAQTNSNEALENLEIAYERLLDFAEATGNKSEISYYRKELSRLRGSSLPVSSSLLELRSPAKQKVGRNDPCPCGSGKKHKKCCGRES